MPLEIVRNDITKMKVDAIVNSASPSPVVGFGVDSAIHQAAGPKLLEARKASGYIDVGTAVLTKAFGLDAKYVIHTVGPVWDEGKSGEIEIVKCCYKNSLEIAIRNNCKSIAFPLISTGTFGFPKDKALQAAISAIGEFLLAHDLQVYLVVYDRKSFLLSEKLFSSVLEYIDDNYVDLNTKSHFRTRDLRGIKTYKRLDRKQEKSGLQGNIEFEEASFEILADRMFEQGENIPGRKIDDIVNNLDESFSQSLLRLIDEKGKKDADVYKRANIDRKLFSKIRNNINYKPGKITAIAFAIALELNLDETKDFLGRAGFALSHSYKFDVIIEYFIARGNYNIFEINETLFAFEQDLLGA